MMRRAMLFAVVGLALLAPAARADFGFVPGSMTVKPIEADGSPDYRAGSHPYAFSIKVELKTSSDGHTEGGELRDLVFDLPPGMVGNPLAYPRCTRQDFEAVTVPNCPPNTQVGVVHAEIPGLGEANPPLFSIMPSPGAAAQFGFSALGLFGLPVASLRGEEGLPNEAAERYGVRVAATNIPIETAWVEATIWGNPSDEMHKPERGVVGNEPFVGAKNAFFTLPSSCEGAPVVAAFADSNLAPGVFVEEQAPVRSEGGVPAPLIGCDSVPFAPQVAMGPTSASANSAAGLNVDLALPGHGLLNPDGVAETQPKKVSVSLEGLTANASAAGGLEACSEQKFKQASLNDPGCPSASKLGTLTAHSPLIDEPVEGSLYLATPNQNRFGTLLSLYLVATAPERGVLVKQAGRVDIDQATGELTTTFDGLPPVPYSSLELNLREGSRAPLTTPAGCGTYQASMRLTPFSAPGNETVRNIPFKITSGPEGRGCVSSEAELPNAPTFEAGTTNPLAGDYSPFVLRLSRSEASQRIQALNVTLPPGLTGRLVGTAECSSAQIAVAQSRTHEGEGALEQASPSCPATSEIGTVTVGAGSGTPFQVEGRAYLAGPYKGAPLSMAIVTPAIAGPFDLGTVVVRAGLYVNESTARISVKSDPIPASLHGIPLDVRSIAVNVAKKDFTLNPTNCEAMAVTGEAISISGQVAALQNRFKVGGCKALKFEPKLSLKLKGATHRSAHPALNAVVTYPKSGEYANIAGAQVGLPHGLFLDQGNLDKVCKQEQLRSATCPSGSIYGHAKAWSPLLEKPLEGPVYLGVGYGYQLPALVADLNGKIRILLVGKVDTTKKAGLRNTFEVVPDAPVSRFVLKMKGGAKYGLLQNSENLCSKTQRASARLVAQNGLVANLNPKIGVECGK